MNIEHVGLLSWVHERTWAPKTQRPCARLRDAAPEGEISIRRSCHGLYISDGLHPFNVRASAPPSGRIAAGRLVASTPVIPDRALAHDRLSKIESPDPGRSCVDARKMRA